MELTVVFVGLAEIPLRGILLVFDLDDVPRVTISPFGKTRTAMGRRAGILTQTIPRAHSITERLRVGTL